MTDRPTSAPPPDEAAALAAFEAKCREEGDYWARLSVAHVAATRAYFGITIDPPRLLANPAPADCAFARAWLRPL